MKQVTVSVIIPTRNRVTYLIDTLRDLCDQSRLPDEIIIVDASDIEAKNQLNTLARTDVPDQVDLKIIDSLPGLPMQRNVGIEHLSRNSWLTFILEDDVRIRETYIADSVEYFTNNQDVCILVPHVDDHGRKNRSIVGMTVRKVFLLPHNGHEGYLQRSGFPVLPYLSDREIEVSVMGGIYVAKTSVFQKYRYDESLSGWAYMEDVDFASRVHVEYKIFYVPSITIEHLALGTSFTMNRTDEFVMRVTNHKYLFEKNRKLFDGSYILYQWSQIGVLIYSLFLSCKIKNLTPLKGYIIGQLAKLRSVE